METKMEFKLFEKVKIEGFEIIGHGQMIENPTTVGDWYCVPLDQYKSTIPPEAHQAIVRVLKSGVAVKDFIVADDIKKVKLKEKAVITLQR